jgi:hypothetical protein
MGFRCGWIPLIGSVDELAEGFDYGRGRLYR